VKPPQKKKQKRLTSLIVQAGIARSIDEARAMFIAGEICYEMKGADCLRKGTRPWKHGKPLSPSPLTSEAGSIHLDEDAGVVHRSKCSECSKPIVFAKRTRKPAVSSTTHGSVLERLNDLYKSRSNFECVTQEDLDLRILRQEELAEVDERIAVALFNGAAVEDGIRTAQLIPTRDVDGSFHLKLVVR